jgi:mannitol/fructose-specific phosphotransferase system IIA component (Ntr-type)
MSWVNESRIVVTVLDEPIYWNDEYVDVIFLLAVKMTSQFEIRQTKQFYKDFIRLTDDDNNMELIRKMDSAMDVYQYFIK